MRNAYDKWLAGEGCCNANNFIHIESADCKKEDVCECERILLEISNLHTDDLVLQEQIDYVSGVTDTKLDASAYTPVDLTAYATKEWVEDKGYITTVEPLKTINGESLIGEGNIVISGGSGTTVDAYTKAESDARFQPIGNYLTEHQPLKTINGQVISGTGNIEITASGGTINIDADLSSASTNPVANSAITEAINAKLDASAYTPTEQVQSDWNQTDSGATDYIKNKPTIPSLSGYATEQWVLDKHYITGVDLSDYSTTTEVNNYITEATSGLQETLTAGHAISINSGNTISLDLPISAGTGSNSTVVGSNTMTKNDSEQAIGQWNYSSSASTSFGHSGNTIFSIGNGTAENDRHNAFEVRQNGDIYIKKDNEKIKLQDSLCNCQIIWCGTQEEYEALSGTTNDTLYLIHE